MRLYLFGDSHTGIIRQAVNERKAQGGLSDVYASPLGSGADMLRPFARRTTNGVEFLVEEYAASFRALTRHKTITARDDEVLGLMMGLHTAHVVRDKVWHTHAPVALARELGRIPLSEAVIDRIIDAEYRHILEFWSLLQAEGVRFFVISGPPPLNNGYGNKDQPIRIEIHRRYIERISGITAERGIHVIHPPEGITESSGYRKEAYRSAREGDPHHANIAYGQMMLDKILAYAGETYGVGGPPA